MAGISRLLVAVALTVAGLLAGVAESLPGTIPDDVPEVCVALPALIGDGLQAGYCP